MLYKAFAEIGGVAHTHSEYATAWAQARRAIPCFGTTHADYFHGPVPVTVVLTEHEIAGEYERNTGHAIVRACETDAASLPACWWPIMALLPGERTPRLPHTMR